MKINPLICFGKPISLVIVFGALIAFDNNFLNSEELYLQEMKIESSTKFDEESSELPTNPFEIVEMIRKANSLNDATLPSNAIDDALNSFNMINNQEKL